MKKIDEKLVEILSSDLNLKALTGNEQRIYPDTPNRIEEYPCIVYGETGSVVNSVPENTQVSTYEIYAFGTTKKQVVDIIERVKTVLMPYTETGNDIFFKVKLIDEGENVFGSRNLQGKMISLQITTRVV